MKTPLALAALLLASAARAGDPAPAAPAVTGAPVGDEARYYSWSGKVAWWGDVVSRRSLSLVADLPNMDELCMIPPAADWVTDGAAPEVEDEYEHLLWRTTYSLAQSLNRSNVSDRTIGTCGVNADAQVAGLGEFSNAFVSTCLRSKTPVKGAPLYAGHGKTISNPGVAVRDTLLLLLKSKNPKSVMGALTEIRSLTSTEPFKQAVKALAKDKSVTATITLSGDGDKETIPLRVYAMRTLATIDRTQKTAQTLALIWHDTKEPEEIRVGALRAFAFIVEWPGPAITAEAARPAMHKALYPFIVPLAMIAAAEHDKAEEAGAKAKVSALGAAADCAVERFPRELREKAKRGEKL